MPAQVTRISDDEIHLEGLTDRELQALRARGLAPTRSYFGCSSIPIPRFPRAITDEPAGIATLVAIAEAGLAFLRDPRQGWSPADLMELLVERGDYRGELRVCAFDGTRWLVSTANDCSKEKK